MPLFMGFKKLGLRKDTPPSKLEVLFHICLWSIIIEFIGPYYLNQGYSDPWDVVCYLIGGGAYSTYMTIY